MLAEKPEKNHDSKNIEAQLKWYQSCQGSVSNSLRRKQEDAY